MASRVSPGWGWTKRRVMVTATVARVVPAAWPARSNARPLLAQGTGGPALDGRLNAPALPGGGGPRRCATLPPLHRRRPPAHITEPGGSAMATKVTLTADQRAA